MFFVVVGIMFRDVTTLLLDHKAFKDTIDIFVERYQGQKVDVIVGKQKQGLLFLSGYVMLGFDFFKVD